MAPFEPHMFGKYHLIRRIALGGMAEIFLAKAMGAEGFQRDVAIKRILPTFSEDEAFITMFIDEARIAARLHHPNIIQILDFDRIDDSYYIAMEFVNGRDLRKVLDRGRDPANRITPLRAVSAIADIASALGYAHQVRGEDGEPLNIVHRDVSPHNILLSFNGVVKLTDFGIAKAAARSTRTRAGTVKGKCSYMSPEQARGKPLDGRSDLFALCAIAWEMLTGNKLFDGDGDFDVLNNVVNQQVEPPSRFNDAVPEELDQIVMRGLERDLDRRWPDMQALEGALRSFVFRHARGLEEVSLGPYLRGLFADEIAQEATSAGVRPQPGVADRTPSRPTPAAVASAQESSPVAAGVAAAQGGQKSGTLLLVEETPRPQAQAAEPRQPAKVDQDGLVETVPVGELRNEVERYLQQQAQGAAAVPARASSADSTPVQPVPAEVVAPAALGPRTPPSAASWRRGPRAWWLAGAGGAALLLLALWLGFGAFRGPSQDLVSSEGGGAPASAPQVVDELPPAEAIPEVEVPVQAVVQAPQADDASAEAPPQAAQAERDEATPPPEPVAVAPEAPPSPAVGTLRLTVSPASADVTVDGRAIAGGGARDVPGLVVGGTVRIEAKAQGYKDLARDVQIEGPQQGLSIRLVAAAPVRTAPREIGYVSINAKPWADVFLKGRKIGTTPVRDYGVEAGNHTFVLRNQTGTRRLNVKVQAGKTTSHVVEM